MRKTKYYYNNQTLTYEKFDRPLKSKILRGFGVFSAILITAIGLYITADHFLPSQKEKALLREIGQMKSQYQILDTRINALSGDLAKVHERDAGVHRYIFGMDPIDESVWEGGVGGHDKYAHLFNYDNSGELIIETHLMVDKLETQLKVQAASLDSIENLTYVRADKLASIPSIKPVRVDLLKRSVTMLSGYGKRMHPVHKVVKMHLGLDFTAPYGTAIQATGNGKVVVVRNSKIGYGKHVVIDHGYGYRSLYGHMGKIDVTVGQEVKKGQKIGSVGSSGTSTAPHCHYEVRKNGKPVNPINYCLDGLSPEEYSVLVERASVSNQSFD